jgi:hypothetical protein
LATSYICDLCGFQNDERAAIIAHCTEKHPKNQPDDVCAVLKDGWYQTWQDDLLAGATLAGAAWVLLHKLDQISNEDFGRGAERAEREALRLTLAHWLDLPLDRVTFLPYDEAEQTRGKLAAAAPAMAKALAYIAVMCSFVPNATPRDVRAAELASQALDLAGITDPGAWLKAHKGAEIPGGG